MYFLDYLGFPFFSGENLTIFEDLIGKSTALVGLFPNYQNLSFETEETADYIGYRGRRVPTTQAMKKSRTLSSGLHKVSTRPVWSLSIVKQ